METGPSCTWSRAARRPPRGCARTRRPLLLVALGTSCLCAASLRLPPAFAAGSGAGRSWRGLQPAARHTATRAAASELGAAGAGEEQTAQAPPKVALADLQVGQTVEGTVARRKGFFNPPFGIFVDVGAEAYGLVENEELTDKGIPEKPKLGTKVTARVLKVEDGKLWLTFRSGDLARPKRDMLKDVDVSPFAGVPVDQWFDGEVTSFLMGRGAFVKVETPGTNKLASGVLLKEELGEGLIDNIHIGMKVRVRVLACDTEKGRLDFTMKDP